MFYYLFITYRRASLSARVETATERNDSAAKQIRNDFLGVSFLTFVCIFATLLVSGSLTLFVYRNRIGALCSDLGTNNPISLGALLTGLIAVVALYYAIEIDHFERFRKAEGEFIQLLSTLAVLIGGLTNLIWEYLRVLGAKLSPECSSHQSAQADISPNLEEMQLRLLFSTLLSPNIILLTLVTVIVISLAAAARSSLSFTLRQRDRKLVFLSSQLDWTREVIATYKQAKVAETLDHLRDARCRLFPPRVLGWIGLIVTTIITYCLTVAIVLRFVEFASNKTPNCLFGYWLLLPGSENEPRLLWVVFAMFFGFSEAAMFYCKRRIVSLESSPKSGDYRIVYVLLVIYALAFLLVIAFLGLIPLTVAFNAIYLRLLVHDLQVKDLKAKLTIKKEPEMQETKNTAQTSPEPEGASSEGPRHKGRLSLKELLLGLGLFILVYVLKLIGQKNKPTPAKEAEVEKPQNDQQPSSPEPQTKKNTFKKKLKSLFRGPDFGSRILFRDTLQRVEKMQRTLERDLEDLKQDIEANKAG
ncbi:hypothetical protein HMPREF3104_02395 [Corynebacterium sp. HMSC30G07]|nr:hypothetical protein HMPREF3104_02395 [Corynebacterium sp. HMSC30G07]